MKGKDKKKLKLVKDKDVKKYDIVTIFTMNEKVWDFNMIDWDLVRSEDNEWIDLVKVDGSQQYSFYVNAIVTISYRLKHENVIGSGGGLVGGGGPKSVA